MENLTIDAGQKRLSINGDPNKIISFNPLDVTFAENFYQLIREFEEKEIEYRGRLEALEKSTSVDARGLPNNTVERLALMKDICVFLRGKIDDVFGSGTSITVFGDAMNMEMFEQFFEGILPFVQRARTAKMEKYTQAKTSKVLK